MRSNVFEFALIAAALTYSVPQRLPAQSNPIAAPPQAPTALVPSITFDTVSVRPDKSDTQKSGFSAPRDGDSISYINMPLFYIVALSNNFHRFDLVLGMPDWTRSERYDITAKVAEADLAAYHNLTGSQRSLMFQSALEDRFKLKIHREFEEMPVYDLVVAKGGPKMHEAAPGENCPNDLKTKYGQSMVITRPGRLEAQGAVMSDLALFLSNMGTGRSVVDKTALTRKYDFTLQWLPDQGASSTGDSTENTGPSLFTAVQEQLGLKLESSKGQVECLVVDHVERPTDN
jgi:uncharacterized protein (TIGR03435 family)